MLRMNMRDESKHYLIERRAPASSRVTIVFAEFLTKDQGLRSYAFRHLLSKLSVNVIYVRDPANQWYNQGISGLGRDIGSAAAGLKDVCASEGFSEIGCVGASMGGYGALAFARELGADAVLAFAPQTFLAPPYPRYKAGLHGDDYLDLSSFETEPAPHTHIVVSEDELFDVFSVLRLPYWTRTDMRMIRQASHLVPRALHLRQALVPALEDFCRTGGLSVPAEMLSSRDLSASRDDLIAAVRTAYAAGASASLEHFMGLLHRYPDWAGCHLWAGRSMRYRKDPEGAVRHLNLAFELNPTLYEAMQELSYHHKTHGNHGAAAASAIKAEALNPSFTHLRIEMLDNALGMAEASLEAGELERAHEILRPLQDMRIDPEQIGPEAVERLARAIRRAEHGASIE
jgi:tetratricopeptide (TPR) repeat protein